MKMQRIADKDQAEARAALEAAISMLLNGEVENVVAIVGRWKINASRDPLTGYHIRLWCP